MFVESFNPPVISLHYLSRQAATTTHAVCWERIKIMRQLLSVCLVAAMVVGPGFSPMANASQTKTATPIKHIVIIFGENQSFDHYFGTYPTAKNPPDEPKFFAAPNTPTVNGFGNALLNNNPNLNPANGTGAANPFRLD